MDDSKQMIGMIAELLSEVPSKGMIEAPAVEREPRLCTAIRGEQGQGLPGVTRR